MTDNYVVELKDSVFRGTPLSEDEYETGRLRFDSKADAQEWVDDRNAGHSRLGRLVVHTAHPNDSSDVDAYIVYKPSQGVWTYDP
jgi:hypothetical protein